MPAIKISALPQQTSTTTLDIVPIVDSGSTQTSKITLEHLRGLTNGAVYNSIQSSSGLTATKAQATASGSIAIGDAAVSVSTDAIAFGTGADAAGADAIAIGAETFTSQSGNTAVGAYAEATGTQSTAIGFAAFTQGSQAVSIGYQSYANGGDSIALGAKAKNGGSDSIVIGANAISNNNSNIVMGKNAQGGDQNISLGYNIINYASQSVAIGTAVQHQTSVSGGITIGYANDMLDNGGGNTNVLIGYDRTMRAKGGIWVASNSGLWVDYSDNSVMLGGRDNTMSGDTSIIINGSGNTASNLNTGIIGGTGNTASLEGSMMINTFDRTSVFTNTTHVENIHTYKTETFSIIDAGNVGGSVDVPCQDATIFKFTLTADTTPNFVSPRTGQRFIFIVSNTTYNVPNATVNGVGSTVYSKNGTISPSNNGVTKYTATFDGTYMYLDEELGFSLV